MDVGESESVGKCAHVRVGECTYVRVGDSEIGRERECACMCVSVNTSVLECARLRFAC